MKNNLNSINSFRWINGLLFIISFSFLISPTLSASLQNNEETLRINTDLVLVNVTVTDQKGKYVGGLHVEDFDLFEDGESRKIDHFSAEDTPFAATILIDASSSMKTKIGRARIAAARFQELLRPFDTVAIYSFNTIVEQVQDFSSKKKITGALWNIEARSSTKLFDCINEGISALDERKEQRRAILLISDGEDTNSHTSYEKILQEALDKDVVVYAVDLVDPSSVSPSSAGIKSARLLQELSTKTGGRYLRAPAGKQLDTKFEEIIKELRQQYTLGFYPQASSSEGNFHKIEVKINRPNLRLYTRQEYY